MTAITSPRRIQGCAIALAVALLGLTAWSVIEARRAALEQAAVDSRNLAQALQQHTLQAFQAVDLVLRGLADRLGTADVSAMPAMLARQSAGLLQIRAMAVLDAAGVRIADSGEPLGDAGREADQGYFTAPRAQPGLGLYIGPPVKSPRDGRWVVPMSRRFTGTNGEFAGVVMAALDAGYFQDYYDRVEVGPHGGIVLFGTDGTLYFRKPYDPANVGRNVLDRPTFREHLLRDRAGTEEITPSIDLITRISSHRQLDTYPFVIVVGLAKDDVLAAWRRQAAVHLSAASVLALTVLALGFLLDREVRRRAAAEAEARGAADRFHRDKVMLEAVLNAMPDGIVLLDQRGGMLLWNDLLFQVLELERADIVDAADPTAALTETLWARGDGALAVRDLATAAAGASVEELRLATGKWIECRMTHVPGLGCIAIYRDIAERKRREIEMVQSQHRLQAQTIALARLAEDLDLARQTAEAARIEAETASRTKSSFIAGMNHELRTPLNAILGFAQVIRDQRFGDAALPRYSEYAGHIISSGEHLLSLINDLLDLAKIEAGKMDLQAQPVDLKQLLASTILMVKETAANGRIAIDLNTPDEAIMLPADPRRLKQCFLNLVSNAVKFTPEGGRVAVSVTAGRDSVEIAVADTGIGVKPGDIAKIFEPFGQIDSPLARRHVGTGLGLPLARSLIEMHGGDLSFRSVEGSGTTVTVSLPRQRLVA
jgi:signal transduction histidine kinase